MKKNKKEPNYRVDAYGEGSKKQIIEALRNLANLIESDIEIKNLDGDGYETEAIRIDFTEE
jgi:hypothetical protein